MDIFSEHKLIISTLMVLLSYPFKYYICLWLKRRAKKKQADYRYLTNTTKNIINLLLIILLFYFWSEELQKFALSIAAFIVAIVLATREYIQCFIGFLYVTSTSPFRIGDWVKTGNYCGEVTATDWAKLTMLEIDEDSYSYTGRTLFIPNNQLITQPIKNLNFLKRYVSHSFTITMDSHFNPYMHEAELLTKASEYCADFYDVAERYNSLIENRLDVNLSGPIPKILISTTDMGRIKTTFEVFCPTEQAIDIEQKLTKDFFSFISADIREKSTKKDEKQ